MVLLKLQYCASLSLEKREMVLEVGLRSSTFAYGIFFSAFLLGCHIAFVHVSKRRSDETLNNWSAQLFRSLRSSQKGFDLTTHLYIWRDHQGMVTFHG